MTRRELALQYVWTWLGTPYGWGGDDFSAFDCSGLMIEVLSGVGAFPRGQDTTADGLMRKYPRLDAPRPGCLVFRVDAGGTARHVEMCYQMLGTEVVTIGASGGGSATQDRQDAIDQNAYVKLRPWPHPPATTRYAEPFSGEPW